MGVAIEMVGKTFGRLTVLQRTTPIGVPIKYLCQCNCGKQVEVVGMQLRNGDTKSCGCLQRELASKRLKKTNKYDLTGDFGIGYTFKGEKFYFDIEDYDKIKDYCWFINNTGYAYAKTLDGSGKHILFHRVLLPDTIQVDHINHNRVDNRRSNLRSSSNQENMMNKSIYKNNTSGVTGVTWHKRDKIWEVHIRCNDKAHYLGRYIDFNEAVRVRKAAEKEYFGNYHYEE